MMPKRHFQAPTSDAKSYRPEVEIALQNELRALADIEALYEEQRENLERSAVRPSVKEHLARQLEQRRASARDPRVKRLSELRKEILKMMRDWDRTVH